MISSRQECEGVLHKARIALEAYGKFWLGNDKIETEMVDLELLTASERFMSLDLILNEIGYDSYQGPAPPQDVSSHPPFKGFPLHAFCWNSVSLGRRMYFKFSIITGSGRSRLAVYSLHAPRS